MTKYPNDEFDRVPEFTDRKGVHRHAEAAGVAVPRSPLGWIVGFGILALVVGLFSFFVLPQLTGKPVATTAASSSPAGASPSSQASGDASPSGEPSTTASPSASDEASETPSSSEPADESSSSASESSSAAESSSSASATADTSTQVGVYNGSRRSGLAGTGKTTLTGAGFTNVSAGNWTKKVSSSVVYYKSDDDKATAEKAASTLGIATIYQTPNIPGSIAVVLGPDFG